MNHFSHLLVFMTELQFFLNSDSRILLKPSGYESSSTFVCITMLTHRICPLFVLQGL